jgi:transcriptional regulator with XRE-family HTH domain
MYDLRPLKTAMAEQGFTPRTIAEKAGLKRSGVRDMLNRGSGRPGNVKKLADALGVPMKELMKGKRRRAA